MSGANGWTRRAWLAGAAALMLTAASPAFAQDPRASLAQKTARDWLALADRLDAPGSHRAAGKKFRDAITVDRWRRSLDTARVPIGKVTQRTLIGTSFQRNVPGVPVGDYALLQYRTSFEKKPESRESLTLERESDGQWRVIGYFIR